MLKLVTLIPTTYNTGEKVEREIFQNFETKLIEIAGGFSSEGYVEGGWKGPDGEIYRDKSKKYTIATDEETSIKLIELIKETGKTLEQKAMYIELNKVNIQFLEIE